MYNRKNRQVFRKPSNRYTRRVNEDFSGNNPVYAAINIEPSTPLDLSDGEEVTADMFTDPEDEHIAELISIGDTAMVDDVLDDGTYKLVISVSEPDSATDLYNWIINNTNVDDDETIEQYVAPGLLNLMDADIEDADDDSDLDDLSDEAEDTDDEEVDDSDLDDLAAEADAYNESVSSKFSKYRNLYESAVTAMNEDDSLNERDDKEDKDSSDSDDDLSDIFSDDPSDNKDDDKKDDSEDASDKEKDSDDSEDADDSEDVPMTAVVLTVKKDDVDKCKDEMVSAGIPDEDIEVLDGDDDDENVKIKVDANSVKELKDYLQGKGIDLEEKIGGEIIDDEEGEEDSSDDSDDKDKDDKDDDTPTDDFDMSDLFGDDDDSADSDDDKK